MGDQHDTERRGRRWNAAVAAVVAACLALPVGCADDDTPTSDAEPSAVTTSAPPVDSTATVDTAVAATTAPATSSPSPASLPAATVPVNVYWAWTIPTHYQSPERLGAGGRTVAEGDVGDVVAAAIDELLDGPNDVEADIGMLTTIPAGTELLGVEVRDGTATVDLDATFAAPGGTLEEMSRLAQLIFTATAVDGVDRVRFAIDGAVTDPVLSHGVIVGDGLTRDDVEEVRPLILVESPTPGDVVEAGPVTVTGESNTFEATVQWLLADDDGEVVDEGFTTATAGMGTWGTFEFDVDVAAYAGRRVALLVFESSPEDGAQRNVVEIPIEVG